jgi:hypothetical protein
MRLENIISNDPFETDTWEVDYFDEDCAGRRLKEPLLGVRVNGGAWLEVRALLEHIEQRKEQLNADDQSQ